jgi:ankyrin repeat protein
MENKKKGYKPKKQRMLEASAMGCNLNILSLINQGVDIHIGDENGPDAPLRYACANGHPSTVVLLLNKGADPNVKSGLALKLAAMSNSIETLTAIVKRKIKIDLDNQLPQGFCLKDKARRMT